MAIWQGGKVRAQEIQIHNFRSILDATIVLDGCNSLVGINNSGKTTVIDCIRAFYEKDVKPDIENNRDTMTLDYLQFEIRNIRMMIESLVNRQGAWTYFGVSEILSKPTKLKGDGVWELPRKPSTSKDDE